MKFLKSIIIGLMFGQFACRSTTQSHLKDILPVRPGEVEPSLGDNYDSLSQVVKVSPSCIVGNPLKVEMTRIDVDLMQNVTMDKMVKEFVGEVTGTPRAFFLETATGGFLRTLSSDKSSINIIYVAKIAAGGERLSAVRLVDGVAGISEVDLLNRCGDHFVTQINRGGALAVTIKVDFESETLRQKWQGVFNLSGPWGKVKQELKNQIEYHKVSGKISISTNQIGGVISSANSGVKVCSMAVADDYIQCLNHVDEIIEYASRRFPAEVMIKPVMLSYVTSPLRSLGLPSAPQPEPKVLQIRADLQQKLNEFNHIKSGLEYVLLKGMKLDSKIISDIDFNLQLIKNVANSCYQYQFSEGKISFDQCLQNHAQLASGLRPIPRKNSVPQLLSVSADRAVGASIVNPYRSNMDIQYIVEPNDSWFYGTYHSLSGQGSYLRFDGVDIQTGSSLPSHLVIYHEAKKGAMLVRNGGVFSPALSSASLTIAPGEAVSFLLNGERGRYLKNKGAISVFWLCTNCQDDAKELPTYKLNFLASQPQGVEFKNRNTGTTYNVSSYGEWRGSALAAWSDAAGQITGSCRASCQLPDAPPQTLIIGRSWGSFEVIGRARKLQIAPSQTVQFLFNEDTSQLRDNEGELEIVLQCIDCF